MIKTTQYVLKSCQSKSGCCRQSSQMRCHDLKSELLQKRRRVSTLLWAETPPLWGWAGTQNLWSFSVKPFLVNLFSSVCCKFVSLWESFDSIIWHLNILHFRVRSFGFVSDVWRPRVENFVHCLLKRFQVLCFSFSVWLGCIAVKCTALRLNRLQMQKWPLKSRLQGEN